MVRVQGDVHVVTLGHEIGMFGERHRPEHHVLQAAGGEFARAGGHLNDAVAVGFLEAFERSVDRLIAGDVDGGIGKFAGLGTVEHLAIFLEIYNRHRVVSDLRRSPVARRIAPRLGMRQLFGFTRG